MKITFSNDEYVRSHGRNPRGDGMWVFFVEGMTYQTGQSKTLTEAKKAVAREVREAFAGRKHVTITVAP